jgi:hypothetical protein
MGTAIQLKVSVLWGFVIEFGRGLRVRLSVDDWLCMGIYEGQWVRIRVPNRFDVKLIVAEVVELTPVIWITLTHRLCNVQVARDIISARSSVVYHRSASHSLSHCH